MPEISIITINYNNKTGLIKTINSVINQTFKNFEYIIIDGGSTDGSREVVEESSDKLTYWVSEPDNGIYNAMNKGIEVSSGDYLLFLNSGDSLAKNNILECISSSLKAHEIIYGNANFVSTDGKLSLSKYPEKLDFYSFCLNSTLCHQASFIKKSVFEEIGNYDETLKIVSDWKLFLISIFKKNHTYLHIDEIIVNYDLDGMSGNDWNLGKKSLQYRERIEVLNKEFPNFGNDLNSLISKIENYEQNIFIKLLRKTRIL